MPEENNMGIMIDRSRASRSTETNVYLEDGPCSTLVHEESVYLVREEPVNECSVGVTFDITKAREDECLVSGWANVAVNADGSLPLDWQDDIIKAETLEKAAIKFMKEYRESGVMHEGTSQGDVVESITFTKEKQECLGIPEGILPEGWFITVKINNPDVFAKVKDGTFKMFSIQGSSKRVKL